MLSKNSGFTLIELMLATGILVGALVGTLAVYSHCLNVSENDRYLTFAMNACQAVLEEIKGHEFASIAADYAAGGTEGNTFTVPGLNSMGTISIISINPYILQVTLNVCWQQGRGRVFGEDRDLDGQIDAGEDLNANGILDSPAQVVTLISDKS